MVKRITIFLSCVFFSIFCSGCSLGEIVENKETPTNTSTPSEQIETSDERTEEITSSMIIIEDNENEKETDGGLLETTLIELSRE